MKIVSLVFSIFILIACGSEKKLEKQAEVSLENNEIEDFHPWYEAEIDSLEMAIYDVAYSLKIPYGENSSRFSPNIYPNIIRYEDKATNNPRQVYLRFMLNRELIDLTYANIILKQELEKKNAKLIEGIFFANWKEYLVGHKLTYRNQDQSYEYIIRLVYDKSPYSDIEQSQEISLILTEVGNNKELIDANLDLIKAKNLTLAFLGDGTYTDTLVKLANYHGIETMLSIPLEAYPNRNSYSQLNAIKVQNPIIKKDIWDQINSLHKNVASAQGISHYWGDFASSETDFMKVIIDYCVKHNLYYIDAMTTSKSKGFELALRNQLLSTWTLSYNQVNSQNLNRYLAKNSNPALLMRCTSEKEMQEVKNIISLIDKKHFQIVNVSDLLNTDLPKID
jgi:polysaccharide deacetylase 2 family uncharacterized protein YibQ